MPRARTKLLCTTLLVSGLAIGMAPFTPSLFATDAVAQQRIQVRQEFRVALEPHGRFQRHDRLGEVWVPTKRERDWRPYTVGRWVYSNDYGWYWNAAQAESAWGWVAYHYGRWAFDRQLGWVWVPGDKWAPAWVKWRRGSGPRAQVVGWAPLPPDDFVADYDDNPDVWIFVRANNILSPRINTVVIRENRQVLVRETVIVNRTVVLNERNVIVNPGIEPGYVAAYIGKPVVSYEVRPRVISGGARIPNAVEVSVSDLRDRRRMQEMQPVVRETRTRIEPVRDVPPPKALQANEQGRLGERPPRAAAEGGLERAQERTTTLPGQRPAGIAEERREMAPGRTGSTPGQAETAPGRAGETPGQSGAQPPGKAGTAPGKAGTTPGQAGTTPGQSGAAPGRSQERGAQQREERSKQERGAQQREERSKQERGAQQREERSKQERGAQQSEERAKQPRGAEQREERSRGRAEPTGATPSRGGDSERGAQQRGGPQRPDAAQRKREKEEK